MLFSTTELTEVHKVNQGADLSLKLLAKEKTKAAAF